MAIMARVLSPLGSVHSLRRGAPPLMPGDLVELDVPSEWGGAAFLRKDGFSYGYLSGDWSGRLLEVLDYPHMEKQDAYAPFFEFLDV